MKLTTTLAGVALALASLIAQAHEFKLGALTVGHPVARPTAPGQPVGGAYMTITNAGADDRLLSIGAANAASVELHTMKMEGDVMRMRQVDAIALPAGQTVKLQSGGYHVMLMGLKAPLKAGDRFPATLKFEKAGELQVEIKVEAPGDAPMKH
jgi:copper(I)-binding protein